MPTGFLGKDYRPPIGLGFQKDLAGIVPIEQASVFVVLPTVDYFMSLTRERRLSESDHRHLIYARNAAQHTLLCLFQQNNTHKGQLVKRAEAALDLCSSAALLYSNFVIFPVPYDLPWGSTLVASIQRNPPSCSNMHMRGNCLFWR